jgi:hypothetical protein
MKSFKILLLVIAIALIFASCENQKTEAFGIKKFAYSDCKKLFEQPETIYLKTINSNELTITQSNAVFSCCPDGKLKIESSLFEDTIILNEFYTDETCNCLCPYDLEYTLAGLDYGVYIFKIQHKDLQYYTFNLNFNSNTDTSLTINK